MLCCCFESKYLTYLRSAEAFHSPLPTYVLVNLSVVCKQRWRFSISHFRNIVDKDYNSTGPRILPQGRREGGRANCPGPPGYVSRTNITPAEVFWIKITSQSDYKNSDFSAGETSPGGNNHNICRATKEITVSPKFGDRQILCARFFLQLRMSFV